MERSEFTIKTDLVVMGIGADANPLLTSTLPELELNKWGYIVADEKSGKTSMERVWAGGDIVTGSATVIQAAGAGKTANCQIKLELIQLKATGITHLRKTFETDPV